MRDRKPLVFAINVICSNSGRRGNIELTKTSQKTSRPLLPSKPSTIYSAKPFLPFKICRPDQKFTTTKTSQHEATAAAATIPRHDRGVYSRLQRRSHGLVFFCDVTRQKPLSSVEDTQKEGGTGRVYDCGDGRLPSSTGKKPDGTREATHLLGSEQNNV